MDVARFLFRELLYSLRRGKRFVGGSRPAPSRRGYAQLDRHFGPCDGRRGPADKPGSFVLSVGWDIRPRSCGRGCSVRWHCRTRLRDAAGIAPPAPAPLDFMTKTRATLIGFSAILMWSLLSLLTVLSGTVPPFQLAAMTFAIAGALGVATWPFRPGAARALKQPAEVWALGVGGLFGYHALFFMALRLAPAAEAQLVSYLWPLLIVL